MPTNRDDHGTNILGNGCTREEPHNATGRGPQGYHTDGNVGWLNLPEDDPDSDE